MADDPFAAVDALLAGVAPPVELPPPAVRRQLREDAGLSRPQVAGALGIHPSTLAGWEAGRTEPPTAKRAAYLRLLEGLAERLAAASPPPADAEPGPRPDPHEGPDALPAMDRDAAGELVTGPPGPCLVCGQPTPYRSAGRPRHLGNFCRPAAPNPPSASAPVPVPAPAPASAGRPPAAAPGPATKPEPAAEPATASERPPRPADAAPAPAGRPGGARADARLVQPGMELEEMIPQAVAEELATAEGDVEAAATALDRRAIPDAMALFKASRTGARYDNTFFPPLPDLLRKRSKQDADEVWEARPKWRNRALGKGTHEVVALDMNAAYLSALKAHLPIGPLEHRAGDVLDDRDGPGGRKRRRSGIYLVDPPEWTCEDLPNPLGAREEPGPLWITDPTLRLLERCATERYGALCEPPQILESWTAVSSENILERFRATLRDARDRAIADGDDLTLEYVKSMYAKFVSTMGESTYNREIHRPDWMHIIRSQAFANLWVKAHKAHGHGLTVVRMTGTDELHLTGGDWRQVFTEGRGVAEVKVKDEYLIEGRG
nr:helix-turn-helix transcriptional regulator [Phaeacidiphilus oryzae]